MIGETILIAVKQGQGNVMRCLQSLAHSEKNANYCYVILIEIESRDQNATQASIVINVKWCLFSNVRETLESVFCLFHSSKVAYLRGTIRQNSEVSTAYL